MNNYLDLVYLTTFDYYVADLQKDYARHPSSLYSPPNDPPAANLTVDFSVQYWLTKGLSPRLIHVGIPLHGQNWNIKSKSQAPYLPPIAADGGIETRNTDICLASIQSTVKNGKMDMGLNMSSFAVIFYGDAGLPGSWIGYDSSPVVVSKTLYAVKYNLGGVWLDDISQDDVKNSCDGGPFPIVNLVSMLSKSVSKLTSASSTTTTTQYSTTVTIPTDTTTSIGTTTSTVGTTLNNTTSTHPITAVPTARPGTVIVAFTEIFVENFSPVYL